MDVVDFQSIQHLSGLKDRARMPVIFPIVHLKVFAAATVGLSPHHLRPVATAFNLQLFDLLHQIAPRGDGSEVVMGVTDFVRRNLFTATSIAFMGPHFLKKNTYQDFVEFDEDVVHVIRRLPFRKGKAHAARERQVEEMVAFIRRYWREEDGGYIEGAADSFMSNVIRNMKTSVLSEEEVARLQNTFMWGSHANLGQVCIWLFYHLLANRNMLSRIQEEVQGALNDQFSNVMTLLHADPRDLEEKTFPLLTSAIQECLRMNSLPSSARLASEDVDIMGDNGHPIRIRKGDIILANILNMHTNADYFEDPSVFKFDRFVRNGTDTLRQTKAFLPFGFGSHRVSGP